MDDKGNHVCMLAKEPKYVDLPPTVGCWRMVLCKIREWRMPCEWHHGSKMYLRSRKSMTRERDRVVELGYWPVLHPYSPIKHYWDCIAFTVGFLAILYIPVEVFKPCPSPYNYYIIIADTVAFLDICLKFITGNDRDGNRVILDSREIARRYLCGTFILDLISTLPFQFIQITEGCRYPTYTSWYLLKLFRLIAIGKAWTNISNQMQLSYVTTTSIAVLTRLVLFIHWMAYIYYQIPIIFVHYYNFKGLANSWIKRFLIEDLYDTSIYIKYSMSLFYVGGMINGAERPSDLGFYLVEETIMSSTIGLIGLMFMVYVWSTLLRMAAYSRFAMYLYEGGLKELQNYMVFKRMPASLRDKIQVFINYKFFGHYFNERDILNTINEQIKQDINMHCCKRLVMNVPLFHEMPIAFLNAIVFKLVQVIYLPGETVIKCDQPGSSIYLIYSGTVAVINAAGQEVAHLRDGSYFGEAALFNPGSQRSSTIIALEITEMYKLSNKEFQSCLQAYPHLKRRLDDYTKSGRRRNFATYN
ncbi:unnamed protein product [Diatraea saccharalis]|uniref:Cyclic nucleotide-binding domain-containing protein n=1 Tax=Diatraea saccharalis TaxID=40085 RepID=A0A9N9RG42_9NEOP|nr:unnamed protein product [Diatraea saccharalis]